jgi:ribosomal-protein-alanine N-acetyltransferase
MLLVFLVTAIQWSPWRRSHMPNTPIPTIETERLLLRGATPDDVGVWADLLDDPDVLRYLPKVSQPIRERAALHIQWCNAAWEEQPQTGVSWMIALKQTGELMGRCGCGTSEGSNEAEVIYTLGKPYWGRGYATEATRALIRYSLERFAWDPITAYIFPANIGSRRVLEHLGFVYERDVDYLELTGNTSYVMESPLVPRYTLARDQFAPGDASYRLITGQITPNPVN